MSVSRAGTNYIEGAGIDITVADNPGLDAVDVTIAATGPATDTRVWMPLFDSDGAVVFDSTGVIPTLIPI